MADHPQIRKLAKRLDKIEADILNLKQPNLGLSSIDGGALQFANDDGDLETIIGQQVDGETGITTPTIWASQVHLRDPDPGLREIIFSTGDPAEQAPGSIGVDITVPGQTRLRVVAPDMGFTAPPVLEMASNDVGVSVITMETTGLMRILADDGLQLGDGAGSIKEWNVGRENGTNTNGSSEVVIPHGLTGTPTSVSVTEGANQKYVVSAIGPSNITVSVRDASTNALVGAGVSTDIFWQAWR